MAQSPDDYKVQLEKEKAFHEALKVQKKRELDLRRQKEAEMAKNERLDKMKAGIVIGSLLSNKFWEITENMLNVYERDVEFSQTGILQLFERMYKEPEFEVLV